MQFLCINYSQNIPLSDIVKELTGVTREKLDAGMDILTALTTFYKNYITCGTIIALNIDFDRRCC